MTFSKHYGSEGRNRKVYRLRVPTLGQIAYTRDIGSADMFSQSLFNTNLHATVRTPDGEVLFDEDLGSGKVTAVGVLAMAANDPIALQAKAKEPWQILALSKFHAWGTSATAETAQDIKLNAAAKPTAITEECVEGTNTLGTSSGTGAPKVLSKATIKANSGPLEIKEWGLHSSKKLEATYGGGKLTGSSATTGTITGATEFTASSDEIRGIINEILNPTQSEDCWGVVTKNTKTVATVPAWYKTSDGSLKEPTATATFVVRPVLWDHKTFGTITVENTNEIEFKYELEIKAGG